MSELTDALIQLLGPRTGLVVAILVILDGVQTRYIGKRFEHVDEKVDDVRGDVEVVRRRVERVEDVHIPDGGRPQPEEVEDES